MRTVRTIADLPPCAPRLKEQAVPQVPFQQNFADCIWCPTLSKDEARYQQWANWDVFTSQHSTVSLILCSHVAGGKMLLEQGVFSKSSFTHGLIGSQGSGIKPSNIKVCYGFRARLPSPQPNPCCRMQWCLGIDPKLRQCA